MSRRAHPPLEGFSDDREARWWGQPFDLRWQFELLRLQGSSVYRGRGVPRGDGEAVMVIPGLFASDLTLVWLHTWLGRMGYSPRRAGLVFNADCWERVLDRLDRRLGHVHAHAAAPVVLIGHSRGGHLARALAHRRPDLVARVVTLGTPLSDPDDISVPVGAAVRVLRGYHATVTDRHARRGCLTANCQCSFPGHLRGRFPSHIPLTSIYSRDDGVVPTRACRPDYATAVEISGSHVGLAWNPQAFAAIAEALVSRGSQEV